MANLISSSIYNSNQIRKTDWLQGVLKFPFHSLWPAKRGKTFKSVCDGSWGQNNGLHNVPNFRKDFLKGGLFIKAYLRTLNTADELFPSFNSQTQAAEQILKQ